MLEEIEVAGFRGIRSAQVRPLSGLVVVTGDNASGKTTLLEAMFLLYARHTPVPVTSLQAIRGYATFVSPRMIPFRGLFDNYRDYGVATISGRFSDGHHPKLRITREPSGFRPAQEPSTDVATAAPDSAILNYDVTENGDHFEANLIARNTPSGVEIGTDHITDERPPVLLLHPGQGIGDMEDGKRFADIVRLRRKDQLLRRLRIFDDRVVGLEYLPTDTRPLFFADIGTGDLVQCGLLGGGFNRVLQMLISVEYCRGGALFVDEIENGIYHQHMEAVLACLVEASVGNGTQLVFSTHSRELLLALARAVPRRAKGTLELTVVHSARNSVGEVSYGVTHGQRALKAIELAEVR